MRFKGTLVEWNDDRGFGFIEPAEGGRVFCHIKAFEVRVRRPMAGDRVTYEVTMGTDGRNRAERVRPVGLEDASYQSNVRTKAPIDRSRTEVRSRKSWMSGLVTVALIGAMGYYALNHTWQHHNTTSATDVDAPSVVSHSSDDVLSQAFNQHRSNVQVQDSGVVERILPDDLQGSQHQRFIVRLASGQTVLIAYNIDLAPRIASLAEGDRVEFNGEYVWNDKGGVIHWTHHDPHGHHQSGWIKHGCNTYE